jgi:hypothetical protein
MDNGKFRNRCSNALWHNAAKRCQEYRDSNDPGAENKAQLEYRGLVQGMEMWKQQSIIREQEAIERFAQLNNPPDDPSLLL